MKGDYFVKVLEHIRPDNLDFVPYSLKFLAEIQAGIDVMEA